jgi:hypothetical protein
MADPVRSSSVGLRPAVERVVLDALVLANGSRPWDRQIAVGADAVVYGPDSPLDSLGLVALVIDIEDGLRDMGYAVELSDAHALSQRQSPFRNVPALVDYILERLSHGQ